MADDALATAVRAAMAAVRSGGGETPCPLVLREGGRLEEDDCELEC